MNEDEIVAQVEKREEAIRKLREALAACREADLTADEILAVVRPLLLGDDGILIGSLVDHLRDGEASTIIRIIYGGLSEGATLSFIAARRTRTEIRALCDEAVIGRANVNISSEAPYQRVSITKLQS